MLFYLKQVRNDETGIRSTETEGIFQSDAFHRFPRERLTGLDDSHREIFLAFIVLIIQCRWKMTVVAGEQRENRFQRTGTAQQMTGVTFGTRNEKIVRLRLGQLTDRLTFDTITNRRPKIDDPVRTDRSAFERTNEVAWALT